MATLTPFGKALRKLRVEKGLRLFDLAETLGQSTAFLSAVETGRKPIPDGMVLRLSRAMDLTATEVKDLRSAADRTRKEVRVDDRSENDRELIAAFARRLDDVPDDLKVKISKIVLKSVSSETPFLRKRKGFLVPPLSTSDIRNFAEKVRKKFVDEADVMCPIIEMIEIGMPRFQEDFVLEVRSASEMGENEGLVPIGGKSLILRQDVYEGACNGQPRDRFTAGHEFGHYMMHRKVSFARSTQENDKIFYDSEWQADVFAGFLLVSRRHLPLFRNITDMADECGISQHAATVVWDKYKKEGLLK